MYYRYTILFSFTFQERCAEVKLETIQRDSAVIFLYFDKSERIYIISVQLCKKSTKFSCIFCYNF